MLKIHQQMGFCSLKGHSGPVWEPQQQAHWWGYPCRIQVLGDRGTWQELHSLGPLVLTALRHKDLERVT